MDADSWGLRIAVGLLLIVVDIPVYGFDIAMDAVGYVLVVMVLWLKSLRNIMNVYQQILGILMYMGKVA